MVKGSSGAHHTESGLAIRCQPNRVEPREITSRPYGKHFICHGARGFLVFKKTWGVVYFMNMQQMIKQLQEFWS
ncbi:hypothetical protein, partial [Laceyella tengchongensis]|uniref:hypothetical protein n=1 Tax=Laceyella tengchongensis TaxID=574699 RepID=UPI001E46863F